MRDKSPVSSSMATPEMNEHSKSRNVRLRATNVSAEEKWNTPAAYAPGLLLAFADFYVVQNTGNTVLLTGQFFDFKP